MTFFNKKEDVIKIELTPHGRKMLSQGKLKPSFYTFLDDDILYDITRGGGSENNSQVQSRILSETPYMKPQTNYKGIDSSKSNNDSKVEQVRYLLQRIGGNNPAEQRAAGWEVTCLLNEVNSASNTLSSSTEQTQPIPQLEFTLEYTMSVGNTKNLEDSTGGLVFNRTLPTLVKNDGSFIDIEEEQILLNIFEKNGFSQKDSYEVEVYLFEQDEVNIDRKLKFFEQEEQIKGNMLLEDNIIGSSDVDEGLTTEHVEYYMDITTDKEIPEEDICKGLRRLKAKDIYLDIEVKCPDRDDIDINFYGTQITPQDVEDC
jgi:hypothetical protein